MTIPRIEPYEMPQLGALPASRAPFRFEPGRAALLVHDAQEYFLDFFDRASSPVGPMLRNVRRLLDLARASGVPVVYTAQPALQSSDERGLLRPMWGPGITQQPHRSAIVTELAPQAGDIVLTKYRYSAFQRTELAELLAKLERTQLVITGLYAHIGCLLTSAEAFMRDIEPFFVVDALADFSRELHEQALRHVASCTGVLTTTKQLADELRPTGTVPSYEAMATAVANLMGCELTELEPETNLLDYGLDSLRIMTLVERFRLMGVDLTFLDLAEEPTLASFWRRLAASNGPSPVGR